LRLCFLSLAAALLAAASTTGCAALHPSSAPSGMEKQIINGEHIGAATRKVASQHPSPAVYRAVQATHEVPVATPGRHI
jgi:hypothetical protein